MIARSCGQLSMQVQLGRYAVLDSTGGLYTVFQCWPRSAQGNSLVCLVADLEHFIQRIRPNRWPDCASYQRPVSVQLLDGLSPKDASVFALVTNAAAQTTAKGVSIETGQAFP